MDEEESDTTLARGLASCAEKDLPKAGLTLAQQIGQEQVITTLKEEIDEGRLKSVTDIRRWLNEV